MESLREGGEGLWDAARTAYDEALQRHAEGRALEAADAARRVLHLLHGTDWRRSPPPLARRARRLAFLCLKYVGTAASAGAPSALAALQAAARLDGSGAGVCLALADRALGVCGAPLAATAARAALRAAANESAAAPPPPAAAAA